MAEGAEDKSGLLESSWVDEISIFPQPEDHSDTNVFYRKTHASMPHVGAFHWYADTIEGEKCVDRVLMRGW